MCITYTICKIYINMYITYISNMYITYHTFILCVNIYLNLY